MSQKISSWICGRITIKSVMLSICVAVAAAASFTGWKRLRNKSHRTSQKQISPHRIFHGYTTESPILSTYAADLQPFTRSKSWMENFHRTSHKKFSLGSATDFPRSAERVHKMLTRDMHDALWGYSIFKDAFLKVWVEFSDILDFICIITCSLAVCQCSYKLSSIILKSIIV